MRRRGHPLAGLIVLAMLTLIVGVLPATAAHASVGDGVADTTWETNGNVFASVQYGNIMFIGGTFTKITSQPPGSLVKVQNLGAVDATTGEGIASFHPAVKGVGTQSVAVRSLVIVGNTLYVGGQFGTVGGQAHLNLAAIDIDPGTFAGTVDASFKPTVGVTGKNAKNLFVYSILPAADGLYIAGRFPKVNGTTEGSMAKLHWDGTLDTAFRTTGVGQPIRDLQWSSDGLTIFVAGSFSSFDGSPQPSIVRIDPATGDLGTWAIPPGGVIVGGSSDPGMTCWSLAVTPTRLFAGCGRGPNYDAAFRLDNGDSGDRTWFFSTSGNDQRVVLTPDGQSLIFGGHFGTFLTQQVCGGSYLKNLGILTNLYDIVTPTLDCDFLPQFWGPNPFGGVWTIQVTPAYLWVGGEFHKIGCDPAPGQTPCGNTLGNARTQEGIARFSF